LRPLWPIATVPPLLLSLIIRPIYPALGVVAEWLKAPVC
jgi:hypothetical protein